MLCEETWALSGEMENFSEWVRARLLANDERTIDAFAEKLARVPTRRLIAITLARIQQEARDAPGDQPQTALEAEVALMAVLMEGME
jgi:hypothetical protein